MPALVDGTDILVGRLAAATLVAGLGLRRPDCFSRAKSESFPALKSISRAARCKGSSVYEYRGL
jgi:hypothetical protein